MKIRTAKIREWLLRYGPAELISLLATLAAAWLAHAAGKGALQTAIAGTIGGNAGYFGTILLQDVRHTKRLLAAESRAYSFQVFLKNVRALFIEFGVAELLDTLLIRPFLLYKMPLWLGDFNLGLIVAKFAADITFYLPAILFYEWSKRRYRKF